jgi:murein DD-endopeptidase MepM/ murein hydrolase activator NlpD
MVDWAICTLLTSSLPPLVTKRMIKFGKNRAKNWTLLLLSLMVPVQISVSASPADAREVVGLAVKGRSSDAFSKLKELDKQKKEFHKKAIEARRAHEAAKAKVREIDKKLQKTTGVLKEHKGILVKTDAKIEQTEVKLEQTKEVKEDLSDAASKRLREIFEGQRISFLEMLFQVDSLQSLLDRFYFQERVAEMDKKLLAELRAKAEALQSNKNQLGEQRHQIGNIVSELAKRAIEIAKEKFTQEQVAGKLKTQQAFYEQAEQQLEQESHQLESRIQQMETSNRSSNKNMVMGSGTLALPISAPVTSPFGWRQHPIFGVRKFHTGVDLAGPNHAAIRAADGGNVLYTGWYGGYGKVAIVSHGRGMATLYAHMSKTNVETGQNVAKGDIVGYEGTTGFSTGPHLHFEVRVNGKPNNPMAYLH